VQEILILHLAKRGEVFLSVSTEGCDHYNKSMVNLPDPPLPAHHDTQTYFLLKTSHEKVVPNGKKAHLGAIQPHTDNTASTKHSKSHLQHIREAATGHHALNDTITDSSQTFALLINANTNIALNITFHSCSRLTFYVSFFVSFPRNTYGSRSPNVDEASFLSSCSLSRLMLYGSVSYGQLMSCFHPRSGGKLYLLFWADFVAMTLNQSSWIRYAVYERVNDL
jgi:hypothetical protein